ncbi:aminotransferase class V-fold PLP-dependent enzyme [soil metagenome]
MADYEILRRTADLAIGFLEGLPQRHVGATADLATLRSTLGMELAEDGVDAERVIDDLARDADPGIVAMAGPRYFGFVIGGSLPVTVAADWLTSAWDQNAGLYVSAPAHSVVEETAARWLLDLFGLPPSASVGLTTGCQMAHFTALAAARRAVLLRHGWDVDADGLHGAPDVHVVAGEEVHVTMPIALQMLGLGAGRLLRVATDGQGRMRPDALREVLAGLRGPTIVCAQVGNVNTGAIDPVDEIADVVREREGAWLHVDGAFGLWAAASPKLRHLVRGVERADSWAADSHKWLNVPYDSGIAMIADPAAHRGAMMLSASYLVPAAGDERIPYEWVPEFSRRGRGFTVYAALRALGRAGVAAQIERGCALAARMAERLGGQPDVEILNEVVLNQVLVRFGDDDGVTRDTVARVQADGTCWLSGTVWRERAAMRISVSNWSTTEEDIDRSADAILAAAREAESAAAAVPAAAVLPGRL